MPLVAEVVAAVVGGDTPRDTHVLEMTAPAGASISTLEIDNDEGGYARALAWLVEHTPGAQVVVGLEGTRSYGIGLARATPGLRSGGGRGRAPEAVRSTTRQVRSDRRAARCPADSS